MIRQKTRTKNRNHIIAYINSAQYSIDQLHYSWYNLSLANDKSTESLARNNFLCTNKIFNDLM